jgi:hypothetical protein
VCVRSLGRGREYEPNATTDDKTPIVYVDIYNNTSICRGQGLAEGSVDFNDVISYKIQLTLHTDHGFS